MTDEAPLYEHDCDRAVFLGRFNDHDLYVCAHATPPTYVARYGDDPADYTSGAVFVGIDREITEAHERAVARGVALDRVGRDLMP